MVTVAANAQINVAKKTSNIQQITLQLKQLPTANTKRLIIRKKLVLISQGLKIDPNNPELLYQQASIFYDIEKYQIASNIANKLVQQDRTNTKYRKLQKLIKRQLAKAKRTNAKLTKALKKNPQDIQTRLMLIENEIILHNHKKALAVAKAGLKIHPNNEDLLYKQMLTHLDVEQYQQAKKSLIKLSKTKSGTEKAKPFATAIERGAQKEPPKAVAITDRPAVKLATKPAITAPEKNFIALESYPTKVKDLNQTWLYNYLTYGHKTDFATYILGVDHIYRDHKNGFRYKAEMYPKINKNIYFHLAYGYANSTFFPRHYALFRSHFLLPKRCKLTLSGRYFKIVNENLWSYSVWLSKFFGNNWFSLRPTFYSAKTIRTSIYMIGIYRYYFNEPHHYISLHVGQGETPDLMDLSAEGFVLIRAWHAFVSYQVPVTKTFFLNIGGGFAREKYPTSLVRRKISALIGFKKLF